jgi:hypothetical protein
MSKKVKIVGYAKRDHYEGNIEYRNFSDNLVGNQFINDEGTALFTLGNFKITTNLSPRTPKIFKTGLFSKFYNLKNLNTSDDLNNLLDIESKGLKLNLDPTDLSNYAYFGSLRERIRVALEDIIITWPASLYMTPETIVEGVTQNTYEDYSYNVLNDQSNLKIHKDNIDNKFNIILKKNATTLKTFNESNKLRDMNISYSNYVIAVGDNEYPVVDFTGFDNGDYVYFTVSGNPFDGSMTEEYHIKPRKENHTMFFLTLTDLQNHLLNRDTNFTADFTYNYENDEGVTIIGRKSVKWPVSDGYNIDFLTSKYSKYVDELLLIAEDYDSSRSNILTNHLVSDSIIEFDTDEGKIDKLLKVYGRNFDDIKNIAIGVKFANKVTYDKKNNTPDFLIKNLARTLGWEVTTSMFDIDFSKDFLTPSGELNLTPVESEIEFWRRLVINTPWILKSKGTRKVVEFLLKFIGTPDGLVTFNEYVYKATNKIDVEELKEVFKLNKIPFNENEVVVDKDGYPRVLPNTPTMYFQKGGRWHQESGGNNSNVDKSSGNNPHVGPYDSGYEYINQYNEIIPNFKPVILTNKKLQKTSHQAFKNYDYGTFDKFFSDDIKAEIDLNIDFEGLYDAEYRKSNAYNEDCDVTSRWYLKCYVDNVIQSDNQFFSGSNHAIPSSADFISGLDTVKSILSLTSEQKNGKYFLIETLENCEAASQLKDKTITFNISIDFDYTCEEAVDCGDLVVTNEGSSGDVTFQNNANNTVPYMECCNGLGYTSRLTNDGYVCENNQILPDDADVYVFMSTSSVSQDDGASAKNSLISWHSKISDRNPNYNGNLYIIPIFDEKWLDYPNKIQSGNMPISTFGKWSSTAILPPNINTGSWVPPTKMLVVAMIDESNSQYHGGVLSDGFGSQPTTHFVNNYKTFTGNLKFNFEFFKGIVFPVIKDTNGETASFALHALSALEGTTLTDKEIENVDSGLNLNILKSTNPYEGYVIPGSNPESKLRPLKELNWTSTFTNKAPSSEVYEVKNLTHELNKLLVIYKDTDTYTIDSTQIDISETDITI